MEKNYTVITDISKIDFDSWSQFVLKHPLGNVFQSSEVVHIYNKIDNFKAKVIVVQRNNQLAGSLVYVVQKEAGVLGMLSSRSIVMGGPLALGNDLQIIDILLKEYTKNIGKDAIFTQFRNLFDVTFAHSVFIKNGFSYEKHLDILIDLKQPAERLKANISKNKRGNISKSLNKGAVFLEITDKPKFLECVRLIYKTYKRIGLPCPTDDYFVVFFEELLHRGMLKVFALEIDDKLIGTRLELCYKNVVYDWWAGADDEYKNFYPNDVIPYQILIWGHQNGYEIFDFGGAGKPDIPYGVREHKLKFGGELVEYGRYEFVHKPLLMKFGKLGLVIYKKLKKYVGSKS